MRKLHLVGVCPERRKTSTIINHAVKVVLHALGLRGDVQPMVALGKDLQAVGKPVMVAALRNFASLVEAAGLSFIRLIARWTIPRRRPGVGSQDRRWRIVPRTNSV